MKIRKQKKRMFTRLMLCPLDGKNTDGYVRMRFFNFRGDDYSDNGLKKAVSKLLD